MLLDSQFWLKVFSGTALQVTARKPRLYLHHLIILVTLKYQIRDLSKRHLNSMLWLKALHIISFVCWFAGLFYLPRLFVYHSLAEDSISRERFETMERKLYQGIMTPSMIATLVFGIWMLSIAWPAYKQSGWLHAKLLLVILLIGYHHMCKAYMRQFTQKRNIKSHIFYRWFNEVPVLLLIVIVILAVVKPF